MSGSVICPACKGNGYIGSSKETDTQTDCHVCKIKDVLI
jgi:hypothetical protein